MSRRLRVVTVTTSYPRWEGDFAGHFIASLAEELASRGHSLTVIAPHDANAPEAEHRGGVRVVRPRYLPDRFERVAYGHGMLPNIRENPLRALALPALAASLRRALAVETREADIVHAHWGPTALLSGVGRSHLPVVVSLHGSEVTLADRSRPWAALLSRSVRGADAVDVMAESQAAILRVHTHFDGPVEIVPSGVPLALTTVARPPAATHGTTIAFVGRLVAEKGVDDLVDAFCRVAVAAPGTRLTVVGTGPREAWARERFTQAGLADRVEFLGALEHDRALDVIARADLLVLPSHGEGSPLSVTEALALGTPVVASDVGALPELVGDCGIVVVKGDVEGLAAGMERMVRDPELRAAMGEQARARIAQTHTWPAIAERVERLYFKAVERHGGKAGS